MNIAQIETKLKNLVEYFNQFEFIYDLLEAYNLPKASITRLKKGNLNLSKNQDEIIWKKKLHFKEEFMFDLHETIIALKGRIKHGERFIIVTDYKTILAIDTVTEDKLDCKLQDLPKHYDFFLPWAGMEKTTHANENPADVKAAERMAKLFDEIKKENPDDSPEFVHSLNVFLSRLLFCFFAEDTNIFEENQFTNAISSHTESDGSDLDEYLNLLFEVLNTPENKRKDLPSFLQSFPYVNGGLFKDKIKTPKFNRKSRQAIIDSGELVWSAINPDIFGSMFQAVISVDQRGSLGQHYTSVPNIMKVIEPLFLNELYVTFEKAKGSETRLVDLLKRIQKIKIFDPACGSGNFLIIAYKELRKLEMKIFHSLKGINETVGMGTLDFGTDYISHISLNNFYGIELDDFAHEIAKLALWLAEHQMNMEFFKAFGKTNPTLPLKDAGQITRGNACRLDWKLICPKNEEDEIYIFGNPPFLGDKLQSAEQKDDLKLVFSGIRNANAIDYISAWFLKATKYIEDGGEFAFVSTNSICQGVQIPILWPLILNGDKEISFAHKSFAWSNSAKGKAKVICIIVGVRRKSNLPKFLFDGDRKKQVKNINAYLIEGKDIIVDKRTTQISKLPLMVNGNIPRDKGNFMFDLNEHDILVSKFPEVSRFLKPIMGSSEFLNGERRFCLWIEDGQYEKINHIPEIRKRIDAVKEYRINGSDRGKMGIDTPYKFERTLRGSQSQLIIPRVSSGRREYVPIGFLNNDTIISDAALALFDPEPYMLGVLSSRMHTIWLSITAGRLKSDYRYSIGVCYNTFPFPKISEQKKQEITQGVFRILEEREKHSDKTMSELYDPEKMPNELKEAHKANDITIEKCYRVTPFTNDEERLEFLFSFYEKLVAEEQNTNTLFEQQKKTRKKK